MMMGTRLHPVEGSGIAGARSCCAVAAPRAAGDRAGRKDFAARIVYGRCSAWRAAVTCPGARAARETSAARPCRPPPADGAVRAPPLPRKKVAFFLTYIWALGLYLYALALQQRRCAGLAEARTPLGP
jgi:hypothetical protein